MMKILFANQKHLDGYHETLNYSSLESFGEIEFADVNTDQEFIDRGCDKEVIVVGKHRVHAELFRRLPSLKLLIKAGVGLERIDLKAANANGIRVENLRNYGSTQVAQSSLGLIIMLASSLNRYGESVKEGFWEECKFQFPIVNLREKTLGLVGLTNISRELIKLVAPFRMKILVHTRYPDRNLNVHYVGLKDLATCSDFVSVHSVLDSHTKGLIGHDFFNKMKNSAFLVNTARAAIVDENAFIIAIEQEKIAGAAFDVFWQEPIDPTHPALSFPNVMITPHMAWAAKSTRQTMVEMIAELIGRYKKGDKT